MTKVEEIGRVCENNRKRLDEVRREVKEIKEKIYLLSLGKEKVKVIKFLDYFLYTSKYKRI